VKPGRAHSARPGPLWTGRERLVGNADSEAEDTMKLQHMTTRSALLAIGLALVGLAGAADDSPQAGTPVAQKVAAEAPPEPAASAPDVAEARKVSPYAKVDVQRLKSGRRTIK
jgi:hypothetical protein